MKRSVLFDARLVLDKPTGIGRYITSLVPELLRLAPDLHIHLLHRPNPWSGYGVDEWQAPNLTHHVTSLPHMSLSQHIHLPRLARRLGVDLLHYPHFDAPVLFGSVPVVSTIYDAKYLIRPDFFAHASRLKRAYMRFSFAQTLRRAAAVITISKATASDLQRLFKFDPARLHTIHLAAALRFKPAGADSMARVRQQYGLLRPFILSVGERRPHKNHVGLIRAYAQSQTWRSHDLVIIGQAYRDWIEPEETADELGVTGHVHFLAGVDAADLVAFYTAADLFVLVSFYEGFGLPVLEAMACGTLVIASVTAATGEITGTGGIQIDPQDTTQIANAIDDMLGDANSRRRQVQRGHEWRQRFSWQRTAQQTIAVYDRVVEQESVRTGR